MIKKNMNSFELTLDTVKIITVYSKAIRFIFCLVVLKLIPLFYFYQLHQTRKTVNK